MSKDNVMIIIVSVDIRWAMNGILSENVCVINDIIVCKGLLSIMSLVDVPCSDNKSSNE